LAAAFELMRSMCYQQFLISSNKLPPDSQRRHVLTARKLARRRDYFRLVLSPPLLISSGARTMEDGEQFYLPVCVCELLICRRCSFSCRRAAACTRACAPARKLPAPLLLLLLLPRSLWNKLE
jgi:hypothetical protein